MNETVQNLFNKWLSGTTCRRYPERFEVQWVSEDGKYAVFRHKGHSEYTGGGQTAYCQSYSVLYDVTNPGDRVTTGYGYLEKWEGRWTRECQADLETYLQEMEKNDEIV